jgi:hypothetical protein
MRNTILSILILISSTAFAQLTILNGAQLTVTNDGYLYANEAIVNQGTVTLNSGKLILANNFNNASGTLSAANASLEVVGANTQSFTFGSNDIVKRVELNKSASTATVAAGKLTITDGFKSVAGTLDAAEKIILQSTSTKTAIVEPSTAGTVTNMVVERFIPAKRAFRLLSSPVTSTTSIQYNWQENQNNTSPVFANNSNTASGYGTHITGSTSGANGFDATQSGSPSLFLFDNSTQAWSAIDNTNTNFLNVGEGYRLMVRGDRSIDMNTNTPSPNNTTLRTKGTLKIGTHTVTGLSSTADAYNFIGNPYQSPVDIEAVLTSSTNINPNYYYVWDPKVGGTNGRGAYVTYTFLNNDNNVSGSLVNQYLQPMQACFVKTLANGASSVVFQESNKYATTNENVYRSTSTQLPILKLNLFDLNSFQQGNTPLDGIMCLFGSDFSNELDAFDAEKLTNLDENLSLMVENSQQSIATFNDPTLTTIYPLSLSNYRHQNYVIKTELVNYDGLSPYLVDQFLGTTTALEHNGTYAFSLDPNQTASSAIDRFKIVFQNSALSAADFSKNIALFPNPAKAGESFYIQGISQANVLVYNLLGQSLPVEVKSLGNTLQVTPTTNLSTGVYLVSVTADGHTKQVKWIVE